MTVLETAELLTRFLPDARFDIGPGYLPDWDRQVQFDLTRSTRDLGYLPAWELEKGLRVADRMDPVHRAALTKSRKGISTWAR